MTKRDALTAISNAVYEATMLLEQLEHAGKVGGNGHHLRQYVAEFAENIIIERWRD
jgi:hypothetical protein